MEGEGEDCSMAGGDAPPPIPPPVCVRLFPLPVVGVWEAVLVGGGAENSHGRVTDLPFFRTYVRTYVRKRIFLYACIAVHVYNTLCHLCVCCPVGRYDVLDLFTSCILLFAIANFLVHVFNMFVTCVPVAQWVYIYNVLNLFTSCFFTLHDFLDYYVNLNIQRELLSLSCRCCSDSDS